MRMRTGRRLAGVLSLSVGATLVAGLASVAAAATVTGGPARAAGTITGGVPAVPGPGYTSQLTGVTCEPAGHCWAVGSYQTQHGASRNEMFSWNGHGWVRASVPEPRHQSGLNAISCTSASSCWAGGSDDTAAGRGRNELLRWDGSSWAQVPVPAGPFVNSEVLGLQCRVPGDCWAVGDDDGGTEALHWAGRTWALTPTPDPGGAGFLFSVRCPLAAGCLAVGFSHVPPVRNLALHWNGRRWAAV